MSRARPCTASATLEFGHVRDRIDAFDIDPLAGNRGADIGLVLVIGRDDLHRLAKDRAADLADGHFGGQQRALAGDVGGDAPPCRSEPRS